MMKYKRINTAIVIIFVILITACGTTPHCIRERTKNIKISWGTRITNTGEHSGYEMDAMGVIRKLNAGKETDPLTRIDEDKFCSILNSTRSMLLKVQAYSVPGDTLHFISFVNPDMNTNTRLYFNPKFTEKNASKDISPLYDSLQALIPPVKRK